MRIVMFVHSLVSDWNHGNAHFLRGVCSELVAREHALTVYEPAHAWSRVQLEAEHGSGATEGFAAAYPQLHSTFYDPASLDLAQALDGADLVLVHEWNDHALVQRLGACRRRCPGLRLLFHDTHHRSVTEAPSVARYVLDDYDGVLAFGDVIRQRYLANGWAARAWTWHEAADVRRFRPLPGTPHEGDLVWIGNWGDNERVAELETFLLQPVTALGLKARGPWRALSGHRAGAIAQRGHRLCGLAAELRGAESVRPLPRYRSRAAAALRAGPARHSDDPHVRGPGLRHTAGVGALGGQRKLVPQRP